MRTSRKDHRPLGFEFDEVGNLAVLRTGDQTEPPLRRFGYDALGRLDVPPLSVAGRFRVRGGW
ncbi:hypothetical protein ACFOED_06455 [Vulcaniibacterium thermophilum]|uniref:YD repeat-containing protein n=1 Tax=Vulcaniibacterium thermophilum TaxID=1169913 RepID=A0A918ZC69_9GAMM|nr:hypothetical protein [Vulcaniibacterium thermophilum]GHE45140.1 hypothetical protein GCM10007167_28250 [Vulcaniibacterium thermophilum]